MLKKNENWYNLPKLQKRILLHLAENGAKTRNSVSQELKSTYKNVLFAFNSLIKKGLIQKIGEKTYRMQDFAEYWLTPRGFMLALINGANPDILKHYAEKYVFKGKTKEDIDLLIELAKSQVIPLKEVHEVYLGVKKISDITISEKQTEEFLKILRKYPTYMKAFELLLKKVQT